MNRTFTKFTLSDHKKAPDEKHVAEVDAMPHDLSGSYPLDDDEADSILEKMRDDEKNEKELERLNNAVQELEEKIAQRDATVVQALGEIESLRGMLVSDLPERILKTADSIVREAIKDKLPEIVKQRIDEVVNRDDSAKFFASKNSADKIGSTLITIDESLPESILVYKDRDGKRHVIELEESL